MLRLADLPKGYRGGDDVGCGQFVSTEGASPDLDTFLSETRPAPVPPSSIVLGGMEHAVSKAPC
jgi:hypothetical protein